MLNFTQMRVEQSYQVYKCKLKKLTSSSSEEAWSTIKVWLRLHLYYA